MTKKDGKRGNVYLVGFTPGSALVQSNVHIIDGQVVDLAEDPRFHTAYVAAAGQVRG